MFTGGDDWDPLKQAMGDASATTTATPAPALWSQIVARFATESHEALRSQLRSILEALLSGPRCLCGSLQPPLAALSPPLSHGAYVPF